MIATIACGYSALLEMAVGFLEICIRYTVESETLQMSI
jgi:hypothetical protein